MRITGLGHSSYLLEMEPREGPRALRILVDPWIDDYLVGDLLGRFPRIRAGKPCLSPLDAIFISHSHTDHLCPYSLARLWSELDPLPELILPQSLLYLDDLFEEHLPGSQRHYLREGEPLDFHGLLLTGRFSPETQASNEDDVMVLLARNGRESFLGESDALLPFYHPVARELITSWLDLDRVETACFLTIKNQGEATMQMLGSRSLQERQLRLSQALESVYEEIHEIFSPFEDLEEDLWQSPKVVRLIGGQGIGHPADWPSDWNRVLFPIRVEDRVRSEREVCEQFGLSPRIESLVPGQVHDILAGGDVRRAPAPGVEVLDGEEKRRFDPELEVFDTFPCAPLRDESRDLDEQRARILECLDHRFLPHLVGARQPPVEHLLAGRGGEYRIRIRFGGTAIHHDEDFVLSFGRLRFHPEGAAEDIAPDEHYWANDLDDFLRGRADEFSLFVRHPLEGRSQRLWQCLGLPYLNQDLIHEKLRFHFERAGQGLTAESWVRSFHEPTGPSGPGG